MANDINKSILIGRLTRDVETIETKKSGMIARFSLASNRKIYNKDTQESREEVGFFDCVLWGKSAENFAKYAKKGSRVCVEGALRWSSWEKDGVKHSKVEINVSEWQLLDPKEKGASEGGAANYDGGVSSENIPF